jgi:cytochrome c oxidase assembly protein subunit 15
MMGASKPDRAASLRIWAAVTTVGLFLVILIGFLDTFTNSAEGCGPDWPLCNGGLLPSPTLQSEIEYAHRAITGIVGLLVAAVVIWAWRRYRERWEVVAMGAVGLGFVVVQSLVGAAAVLWPESPAAMATHFGFALLAFAGFALMTVALFQLRRPESGGLALRAVPVPRDVQWAVFGLMVYLFAVVYWGAYVAHAGAGAACTGWPLCNGEWWPPLKGDVLLIMIHRLLAVGAGLYIVALYGRARAFRAARPDVFRALLGLVVLVAAQIASGAALILSHLDTGWDLLHVSLMTVLFTVAAYLVVQVTPPWPLRRPVGRVVPAGSDR